jgi:two-component system, NtrC family, sensor kinase
LNKYAPIVDVKDSGLTADMAGVSVEKNLAQQQELRILLDISSALYSSPHLHNVLQRALMSILGTLKFRMGALYLVTESSEGKWLLDLWAHHGFSSELLSCIQYLTIPADVMEKYSEQRRPVRWFPISKITFAMLRERMEEEGIEEIICISLMSQDRVLGLLYVSNEGPHQLKPERSDFLKAIGNQLGVVIQNAQLFDSIERARRELEISFDAIQHSIFLVDAKMRIYRVNQTSETVYGEDLIGKRYTRVLYGTEQPHPECPIWACLWGGQPVQREGPHPRWGGFYQYFAFPVVNASGELERVVYYEKDATESRKIEQRLQQAERLRSLGTLAAGIAHEIRNPLATINFNSQLMARELKLDPAQQQMFDDIFQQIRKMDRIIQQVLHFARPREPQFLPYQLNEAVRHCLDMAKMYLVKAEVEAATQLGKDMPAVILDFNQICQVIMNLVINAIEAMPNGGRLNIETGFQEDPPAVVLKISDTGLGIMEEDMNRIFDPFFTRKPEGTGMGLSISRQILEKHRAIIDLESAPGKGTTFRISFPLPQKEGQPAARPPGAGVSPGSPDGVERDPLKSGR